MANEIGYWNGGAGATTRALGTNQYLSPVTAANAYTASAGDVINQVRFSRLSSGTKTVSIGLYEYDAALDRPTGPVLNEVQIVSTASGIWQSSTGLGWSLTAGLDYVLAIGELVETGFNLTADVLTAGTSNDDSGDTSFPTWGHVSYSNVQIEVAGDVINTGGAINTRTLTDNLSVVESMLRSAYRNRFTLESVSVTDPSVVRSVEYVVTGSESVSVADTLLLSRVRFRLMADGSVLVDSYITSASSVRTATVTDNLSVSDARLTSVLRVRTTTDVTTLTDQQVRAISRNVSMIEGLTVQDAMARALSLTRQIDDGADIVDILSRDIIQAVLYSVRPVLRVGKDPILRAV